MRVLFLSKSFPVTGGVERWLADLSKGLPAYGIEPILGLAKGFRYHDPARYIAEHPELAEIKIFELDGTTGVECGRRRAVQKLIEKVRPDIVVPVLLLDGLAGAVARRQKEQALRILLPAHDNSIEIFSLLRAYADHLDLVVSVNALFSSFLKHELNWPEERLAHIRCGARPPVTAKISGADGVFRVGFAGWLTQRPKRALDLPDVYEHLRQSSQPFHLLIAGTGPLENELRERLAAGVASGRVIFLGQVSHDCLYREFFPALDALIITSEWETGPIVAWEAMSHGVVPITSSYRGLCSEGILSHEQNAMIFPIGDTHTAARHIKKLAQDAKLADRLSANAMITAEESLTLRLMNSQWAKAMHRALELPPRSPAPTPASGTRAPFRQSWGLPSSVAHFLRQALGRAYHHPNTNAEWPRYRSRPFSAQAVAQFERALHQFDRTSRSAR